MAMPELEGARDSEAFFLALVAEVAGRPGGFGQTIFELQTVDWSDGTRIPGTELSRKMRWLQSLGVRHLGYYPDDFIRNHPDLRALRRGISLAENLQEAGP